MAEGLATDQNTSYSSEDSFSDTELFLDTVINDEGDFEEALSPNLPQVSKLKY